MSDYPRAALATLPVALFLALVAQPAGPRAEAAAWDEEFTGPFPSWVDVKAAYGARGDGTSDDTAALQRAFDQVAATGHAPVLYLPAGTYRVTRTLTLTSRIHVAIVGEDPQTTMLKWAGGPGGTLVRFSGMAYSKVDRLTFDGAGDAAVLVDQAWDCKSNYFDTGNEYADDVFRNAITGIRGGNNDCGFAETSVWRSRFSNLALAGIALRNFNALDLWVWYSRFENCGVGITNDPGAGNYNVYDSVFRNSSRSDLYVHNTGGFNIRNNTSIGSRKFFTTTPAFPHPANLTLQGNAISTAGGTPIEIGNQGAATILDNVIASPGWAPPISVGYGIVERDGDALIAGNRFTSAQAPTVKGRSLVFDNDVVPRPAIGEPALPPTPRRANRRVFEVPPGSRASVIQQAIAGAVRAADRAIVHLPAGDYAVDTTLTVPANADIQIVGDGDFSSLHWSGAGGGPVLLVSGPTHVTLRDFSVRASSDDNTRVAGIVIDHADQPGSRLFLDQAMASGGSQANILADRLDYLVIDARDIGHGAGAGNSVDVVGGRLAAAGTPATATLNLFSGASCCNTGSTYRVSNGGSLLVRDIWYENGSAGAPYLTATGNSRVTVAGVRVAHPSSMPTFEFADFHGLAALLASLVDGAVRVRGNSTGGRIFGGGLTVTAGASNYVSDTSSAPGTTAFLQTRVMSRGGASKALPDTGNAPVAFVRQALAQTRREQPQAVDRLPDGVTDVRMYRVTSNAGTVGIQVQP